MNISIMQQNTDVNHKKHYLMLCELHYPGRHGKNEYNDKNIETHYLVYDKYDPISGVSYSMLDVYDEYDTDYEYDTDSDMDNERLVRISDEINFLKEYYSNPAHTNPRYFGIHPTIRNYQNIVSNPNYIKPEIGEYIILPTQEAVAILKTFWLRIIQKKWKKVFKERKNIIRKRCYLSNLSIREIKGRWPSSCYNLPGLKGMLSDLK